MSLAFSLSDLTTPEGLERVLRQIENALNDIQATSKPVPEPVPAAKPSVIPIRVIPTGGINVVQAGDRTTITSTGITSITAGAGISVSSATGDITITNTGVTSAIGTANQVNVSAATGAVTLSLPQNIHTGATPQFARLGLGAAADATSIAYILGTSAPLGGAYNSKGILYVLSASGDTINTGGDISFGNSNNNYTFARIHGKKEVGTAGSALGYLAFETDNNSNLVEAMRITSGGLVGIGTTGPNALLSVAEKFQVNSSGLIPKYNNVNTAGEGVPAIYGQGRATGQTGANGSIAAFTPATDGSFIVSMNILVTAFTAGTISGVITYTDEGGTARSLTMNFSSIGGTLGTTVGAAGVFEGVPLHIRAKGGTAITVTTTVAVFTGNYNVEGIIQQIA